MHIEVDDVEAHVAGPRDPHDGVGVGAVVVEQPAGLVHEARDLDDVFVEQPQRVGIGEHQAGDVFAEDGAQRLQVDAAAGVALDGHRLVAGHHDRRGVRAVRRVGDDDLLRVAALREVIGAHHEQPGELAVNSGGSLQGGAPQAGDLGQPALELAHELERALGELLRLVRVKPGEAFEP